jgi:hypothetical protein
METWRHGDMEHGDMETWKHRDIETWKHRDMETWRYGDMNMETSNRKRITEAQAIFLVCSSCKRKSSFVRRLTKKQTEVIRLQTD